MRKTWRRTLVLTCAMACGAAGAQNAAVTVNIDANANRHLISPNVYGVAFGNSTTLTDLNTPLSRAGVQLEYGSHFELFQPGVGASQMKK